jgi:succinylglutamate desuccinylase
MKDNPIISFFGSGMAAGAVIETGSHQSCHAFENAITTTVSFLQGIGVAKQHKTMGFNEIPPPHSREIYAVVDSIYWEPGDENMLLVKPFKSFEPISKGQLLAEDPTTGKKVFSPCDGHVLFPFMTGRPNNMNEEGIFITLPVRSQ